jgi:3-hydroxyisobutyrate dehydrogenase
MREQDIMSKIAFIGLGNMGGPMAANLLKAGHEVAGFDLMPAALAAHKEAGGRVAESAQDAVQGAEIVISMLPSGKHVADLFAGSGNLIALGQKAAVPPLLIDCSTIDVGTTREVAAAASAAGLKMLDAPVSGGVKGAQLGTLTFMVGGEESAFALAKPILEKMGRNIVHAGSAGAGQAAKICNNMILGISMVAVSEAFVLADKLGLDRRKLFDVASTASGQCWSLTTNCPVPEMVPTSPANREYQPGFATALMLKDMLLSQSAAAAAGAATPLGAHATTLYQAMADAGLAGKDFSVAFEYLSEATRDKLVV